MKLWFKRIASPTLIKGIVRIWQKFLTFPEFINVINGGILLYVRVYIIYILIVCSVPDLDCNISIIQRLYNLNELNYY